MLSVKLPDAHLLDNLDRPSKFDEAVRRGDFSLPADIKPAKTAERLLAALEKQSKQLDDHHADDAANRAAEEHRAKIAERKATIKGVIATFVVTVLAGIVLYYWSSIVSFIQGLIH